jgi:hypothetical protein
VTEECLRRPFTGSLTAVVPKKHYAFCLLLLRAVVTGADELGTTTTRVAGWGRAGDRA